MSTLTLVMMCAGISLAQAQHGEVHEEDAGAETAASQNQTEASDDADQAEASTDEDQTEASTDEDQTEASTDENVEAEEAAAASTPPDPAIEFMLPAVSSASDPEPQETTVEDGVDGLIPQARPTTASNHTVEVAPDQLAPPQRDGHTATCPEAPHLHTSSGTVRLPFARHGATQALRLGFLALFFLGLSVLLERNGRRLARSGVLPSLTRSLVAISRTLFIPLVGLSVFALTPQSWGWAEPMVLIVAAAAMGWSSREVLSDLMAGMVLAVEQPFRSGQRVKIADVEGELLEVGPRVTRVMTDTGHTVSLPNRLITRQGWVIDSDIFAPIQVRLYVDPELPATAVREVLEEAALASPWLATQRAPVVYRAPDDLHLWVIEGRLVHPRYAGAFRGSLVELSEGRLAELAGLRRQPPMELRRG